MKEREGNSDVLKGDFDPITLGLSTSDEHRTDMGTGQSDCGIGVVSDKGAAIGDYGDNGSDFDKAVAQLVDVQVPKIICRKRWRRCPRRRMTWLCSFWRGACC